MGGAVTGVATWLTVDKGILEADEWLNREAFEADLRAALEADFRAAGDDPAFAHWLGTAGPDLLAFATLGGIASNNQAKAAFASCVGLGISVIGLDNFSGMPRMTGGNLHLMDGVDFLVAIVGLFAVSEVFFFIEKHGKGGAVGVKLNKFTVPWGEIWETRWTQLRSGVVGFVAGVLPGAGASLGSFLTYMMEKSIAGEKGKFGTGVPKGIAAPEVGNNAAAGGALVPMLTLGVPGSGTTAVLLAVLMTLNITPGPTLFAERPDVVWGLIAWALAIAARSRTAEGPASGRTSKAPGTGPASVMTSRGAAGAAPPASWAPSGMAPGVDSGVPTWITMSQAPTSGTAGAGPASSPTV